MPLVTSAKGLQSASKGLQTLEKIPLNLVIRHLSACR